VNTDAGLVHPGDRCGHLRTGRVEHRHEPGQAKVTVGVFAPGGDSRSGGQAAVGERPHPQPPVGVVGHDPAYLVAIPGGQRPFLLAGMDPGGPGEDLLGRALCVHD
jgi:hypothetical protein